MAYAIRPAHQQGLPCAWPQHMTSCIRIAEIYLDPPRARSGAGQGARAPRAAHGAARRAARLAAAVGGGAGHGRGAPARPAPGTPRTPAGVCGACSGVRADRLIPADLRLKRCASASHCRQLGACSVTDVHTGVSNVGVALPCNESTAHCLRCPKVWPLKP